MPMTTPELVNRINKYISKRGLTDSAFCALAGIDQGTWSRVKAGERQPTLRFVRAISQVPQLTAYAVGYMMDCA